MARYKLPRRGSIFDGLSDRDAARMKAALAQAQPTPGMGGLPLRVEVATGRRPESDHAPRQSVDIPTRKRGRRV